MIKIKLWSEVSSNLDFLSSQDQRALEGELSSFENKIGENESLLNLAQTTLPHFLKKFIHRDVSTSAILSFVSMFLRHLTEQSGMVDWKSIRSLSKNNLLFQNELTSDDTSVGSAHVNQVAILKVNGGLGTTMGCAYAKSLINVNQNFSFLDIIGQQVNTLRHTYDVPIPLILMNSFYTDSDTTQALKDKIEYVSFVQNEFPRINAESFYPFSSSEDEKLEWAPPGHGDIYESLFSSGIADELISQNIFYLFISNSDNLAATFNPAFLGKMIREKISFLMEVTPKTQSDIKGGILAESGNRVVLVERAQVDDAYVKEFEDTSVFPYFNTNNIWVDLREIKRKKENNTLKLPVIANRKVVEDMSVIQLESAMGAAIECFEQSKIICVDRSRFFPIKNCSDLLLLKSDVVQITDGNVHTIKNGRGVLPSIFLGKEFSSITSFDERFLAIPSLVAANSVHLEGNISISENVIFIGNVKIVSHSRDPFILRNQTYSDVLITIDEKGIPLKKTF